jgi:hypothetical protein
MQLPPLIWALVGMAAYVAMLPKAGAGGGAREGREWTKHGADEAVLLRRMGAALRPGGWRQWLPLLPGLLAALGLWLANGALSPHAARALQPAGLAGLLAGHGLALLASLPMGMARRLRARWARRAALAAKMLGRGLPVQAALPLLAEAAKAEEPWRRLAAVAGLRELAPEDARPLLQPLLQDPDAGVAAAAEGAASLAAGGHVPSLQQMDALRAQHEALERSRLLHIAGTDLRGLEMRLHDAGRRLDEAVLAQVHLRKAHPHVYCMDCLRWAQRTEYLEWDWVGCPQCRLAGGLEANVRQVIGWIGRAPELPDGAKAVLLPMWDDARREARSADLHVLLVRGGGAAAYEWAVSAVLEAMANERPQCAFGVVLQDDPPLGENALRLLQAGAANWRLQGGPPGPR